MRHTFQVSLQESLRVTVGCSCFKVLMDDNFIELKLTLQVPVVMQSGEQSTDPP